MEKTLDSLNAKLLTIQTKLSEKRDEYSKLGKSLILLCGKEQKLLTDIYNLSKQSWKEILIQDNNESIEIYNSKNKYLEDYVKSIGLDNSYVTLRFGEYFPDINQRCIRIALFKSKDDITEKIYIALQTILPYLLPIKYNCSRISIFEKTLSEHGSYYFLCKKIEDKYIAMLCVDRYYRSYFIDIKNHHESPFTKTSLFPFFPLLDVLKYIQKYHYYDEED